MNLPYSIKLKLIDSVLEKQIPDSGVVRVGKGAELVDAKVIKFMHGDDPWLIVEERKGDELACSTWNGNTHAGRTNYPINRFTDRQYRITHYYGTSTIYYDGLVDYAKGYYLRIVYVLIDARRALELAGTFLYNRRRLVRHHRLELLTFMIEQAAGGKSLFSAIDLMTDMHTVRWITHPDGESVQDRLKLYLDSLVDTGELTKSGSDYQLTGYALKLVEERSEQERKDKQARLIQWLIAVLTFVTAVLTIVQAGLVKLTPLIDLTK